MLDDRTQSSLLLTERGYRDRALPALRLARSSRVARWTGRALLVGLVVAVVGMFLAPWQQTVAGSGWVVAYDPSGRQQVVQARTEGVIERWADGLRENDRVEEGQFILLLSDVDPGLLSRLEQQVAQAEAIVRQAEIGRDAAARGVTASENVVESNLSNVTYLEQSLQDTLSAADRAIEGGLQKVKAEEQALAGARATLAQAKADHDRKLALFGKGLTPELKYQEAEQKYLKATADVAKHEAYIEDARLAVEGKRSERSAKEGELKAKIDEARAKVRKSQADVAKAESELQKAESEVQKARKDLQDAESKFAKQQRQEVTAPADGFITNLISDGGSGLVKKGDPLFTLVPDVADRAVQIWLDGNDAPLVSPGRPVRLQFEGWPAVQTAGWPSVAVGTFGGTVATVDSIDDGAGRYRVLIVPDSEDDPWPEPRFLRQGVRANGWVMLERVALGYELWRRMNGFPPVLKDAPQYGPKGAGDGKGSPKPVKMGKAK